MASTSSILLLVCFLGFISTPALASSNLPNALFNKGYVSMATILESSSLDRLISSYTNITIFCPTEEAFHKLSSKYAVPPYTLLQYQVVHTKLDRQSLETSLPFGSKFESLLPGYPIFVSTSHHYHRNASVNEVKIVEWDVYNDGYVIVHGVEEFFDRAFDILVSFHPTNNTVAEKESVQGNKYNFGFDAASLLGLASLMIRLANILWLVMMVGLCVFFTCNKEDEHADEEHPERVPLV